MYCFYVRERVQHKLGLFDQLILLNLNYIETILVSYKKEMRNNGGGGTYMYLWPMGCWDATLYMYTQTLGLG